MRQNVAEILTLLERAGLNPQLCDTPVARDRRSVRAGLPAWPGDDAGTDYCMLPRRMMGSTLEFIVDVTGDSMKDLGFASGDRLKVRTGVSVGDGDVVVANIDGEFTVKVFFTDDEGRRWLVPQNEAYTPILLTEDHQVSIVGRVVELIKELPSVAYSDCLKTVRRARRSAPAAPDVRRVEAAVRAVAAQVKNARQWYAVFRALCDRHALAEGNYAGFTAMVARLLPAHAHPPVAAELRRMAVLSFSKEVRLWDQAYAPVSGQRFDDYLRIARMVLQML